MSINLINIGDQFLSAYDICTLYASKEICRDKITSTAPTLIDIYLKTYDNCKEIFGQNQCRKLLAPETLGTASVIGIAVIGFIIGAIIFRKE